MANKTQFEQEVKKLKKEAIALKLASTSKDWNFGVDPHKPGSKLGKRKSLHRACSSLIRRHLNAWIPKCCDLNYCTNWKGDNQCCYRLNDYAFQPSLNLVSLIQKRFELNSLKSNDQRFITDAILRTIIDEKTTNCVLKVLVNDEYQSQFYLKRVKQDRVAKSMDISQNDYRLSYAPNIYIKISDNILMRLSCVGSCVGVGFWNLVKWKIDRHDDVYGIDPFKDYIHSMIHICDSFEAMRNIEISFGVRNTNIDSISIKVIGEHLKEYNQCVELYTFRTTMHQTHANKNGIYTCMPLIGDVIGNSKKRSISQHSTSLATFVTLHSKNRNSTEYNT
eukprot:1024184_1